jgi:hypothetical protein
MDCTDFRRINASTTNAQDLIPAITIGSIARAKRSASAKQGASRGYAIRTIRVL